MKYNVLWTDDQKSFVDTFSYILQKNNCKINYSPHANDAFDKLLKYYFDIILIDLAMPPYPWGGLWLLEQIKYYDIKISSVIISGEGSQSETIQAMRLGAKDYILKERTEHELQSTVFNVLNEDESNLYKNVEYQLPVYLSLPLKRMHSNNNSFTQLKLLFEFFEVFLKFFLIHNLKELQSHDSNTYNHILSEMTKPLSIGFCFHKIKNLSEHYTCLSSALLFYNIMNYQFFNSVIEQRNQIVHGILPSNDEIENILQYYTHGFHYLLKKLLYFYNHKLIYTTYMQYSGSYHIDCKLLHGSDTNYSNLILESSTPLFTNKIYFVENYSNNFIEVYPFLQIFNVNNSQNQNIYIFDQFTDKFCQKIKYLDILNGQRANVTLV